MTSCVETKDIEVSAGIKNSDKSIVYALPLTTFKVTIEVTKTTIKKGPYAEYSEKFLHIKNAPIRDSQKWSITGAKMELITEPDPSAYFTITYKIYPDNIDKLLSVSDKGVILDFSKSYLNIINQNYPVKTDSVFDPLIYKPTIFEKTDTFYKTVLSDSTFRRIPVIKKQLEAKNQEEEAEETANLILKIRKSRIKLLRGKLTYPPDGESLKLDLQELDKLENTYLALFTGIETFEKKTGIYYITPKKEQTSADICYFSSDKGIEDQPLPGNWLISLQLNRITDNLSLAGVVPDKTLNILYFRVPMMVSTLLKLGDQILTLQRFPVYQFGNIQAIPLKISK